MVLVTTMQTVPLVHLIDPPSRAAQSAAEAKAWEESMHNAPPDAASITYGNQCETELGGSSADVTIISEYIRPVDV
jgi:hypothetical protein